MPCINSTPTPYFGQVNITGNVKKAINSDPVYSSFQNLEHFGEIIPVLEGKDIHFTIDCFKKKDSMEPTEKG